MLLEQRPQPFVREVHGRTAFTVPLSLESLPVVLRTLLGSPEILMGTHPVAVAPDVDDVAVVQQPIDERRGHHLVAEHLAPLVEILVRGQHRRCLLVAGVDELEE